MKVVRTTTVAFSGGIKNSFLRFFLIAEANPTTHRPNAARETTLSHVTTQSKMSLLCQHQFVKVPMKFLAD
ncbi:unnamed protein product [Gongylonema pulchrum]|uniref:Secreted protein n=1 Tax=Gongylonema pulchrum TaxID=637853 RepID=A0A183EIL0_9BILA|nr:unnamed protein product [Gongylonema pulchrum]